jgi:hypothetical protein
MFMHSSHVYRYPAQEKAGGDTKIPTIIYYDQQGIVRAVGAEALLESNVEQASDENWMKAEWWLFILPRHFGCLLTTNHCQVQASLAPKAHGIA